MFMARGDVGNVRAGFVKISKDIKHTCLLLNYLKATSPNILTYLKATSPPNNLLEVKLPLTSILTLLLILLRGWF